MGGGVPRKVISTEPRRPFVTCKRCGKKFQLFYVAGGAIGGGDSEVTWGSKPSEYCKECLDEIEREADERYRKLENERLERLLRFFDENRELIEITLKEENLSEDVLTRLSEIQVPDTLVAPRNKEEKEKVYAVIKFRCKLEDLRSQGKAIKYWEPKDEEDEWA